MIANQIVDKKLRREVEDGVKEAETRTSAEIVCAVATESGRYDRAESLGGLFFGLVLLVVVNLTAANPPGEGAWAVSGPSLAWQSIAVVLGFVAGNLWLSYSHSIRRLFTGRREMREESERAAMHVFASQGLHKTTGRGGLLIYVSLYERSVIVEADSGVMEAAGQELLDSMCEIASSELKAGNVSEAFTRAIAVAAGKLELALPVQEDDKNELKDHLLVFDTRP